MGLSQPQLQVVFNLVFDFYAVSCKRHLEALYLLQFKLYILVLGIIQDLVLLTVDISPIFNVLW